MVALNRHISEDINNNRIQLDLQSSECQIKKSHLQGTEFKAELVWFNVVFFLTLHLLGLYSILFLLLPIKCKIITIIYSFYLGYLTGDAITIGAHRLWAHRSFKAKLPVRIVLLLLQTVAGQNSVWEWARDHRQHHRYSDTDADPHNSKRGFVFSHIGWLMMKKHPEVISKGKTIDMSDLEADPLIMLQLKHYKILYFIFVFIIPTYLPVLLWKESLSIAFLMNCMRYASVLNITWCVNSVAHCWGNKPYTRDIVPVESRFVSFISSGEGWHNFHHTFPWDYRAAEFGRSYNANSKVIEWLASIGLVYNLKSATHQMVEYRKRKKGDGTLLDVFLEKEMI